MTFPLDLVFDFSHVSVHCSTITLAVKINAEHDAILIISHSCAVT